MNKKKVIGLVLIIMIVSLVVLVFLNIPKQQEASDKSYNLSELADGNYIGECDNGLVKVKVEVIIESHKIISIKILNHQNGLGKEAEVIIEEVIKTQSVEVDSITGATYSSESILKAIEEALSNE